MRTDQSNRVAHLSVYMREGSSARLIAFGLCRLLSNEMLRFLHRRPSTRMADRDLFLAFRSTCSVRGLEPPSLYLRTNNVTSLMQRLVRLDDCFCNRQGSLPLDHDVTDLLPHRKELTRLTAMTGPLRTNR